MLTDNYEQIRSTINECCDLNKISHDDITLLVVSKTQPVESLQQLYDIGVRHFGENKVQELLNKQPLLPADIKWHLIGHLQTNKVRQIIDKVTMIHSVDSIKLLNVIEAEAKKKGLHIPVLLQINIAGEESKFGIAPDELEEYLVRFSSLEHVTLVGLMAIPPFVSNSNENRHFFTQMRKLFIDIRGKNIDNVNMSVLSMGMSNDYLVAIEEGSTIVRVGTSIFGARKYNI